MKKKCFAKINLILDVIEKREDGYHNIDGVMQLVDIFDVLSVEISDEFKITCSNPVVPTDEKNLVYKAYNVLKNEFGFKEKFNVHIEKNIPVSAGIAGGSSNCAMFIEAVDEILSLELTLDEKRKLGRKIGADIPYMLTGQTARTRGIGDEIEILKPIPKTRILIVNNGIEISTPYVYSKIVPSGKNEKVDEILKLYENENYDSFFNCLYNVMERVSIKYCYEIEKIKGKMLELGAVKSLMSGSGPTVFGIFKDDENFEKAYKYFKNKYTNTFKTYTIGGKNGQ